MFSPTAYRNVMFSIPAVLGAVLVALAWPLGLADIVVIVAAFLFFNFSEYMSHRYLMHRRLGRFNPFYAHVTLHHKRFSPDRLYLETPEDNYAVILPLYVMFTFGTITVVASWVAMLYVSWHAALLTAATGWFYYFANEILHYVGHTGLFQFHLDHHRRPSKNFNFFFPVFDWVFQTAISATAMAPARARSARPRLVAGDAQEQPNQ